MLVVGERLLEGDAAARAADLADTRGDLFNDDHVCPLGRHERVCV